MRLQCGVEFGLWRAAFPAREADLERRPTVLLADDNRAMLDQVSQLLQAEFDVVGTVEDGQALLAAAANLQPDVAVIDISMPLLNGFQAARQLKKAQPDTLIVFLTVHEEPLAVREALAIGAEGFVLKRSAGADLIHALRQVLQGGRFVSQFPQP